MRRSLLDGVRRLGIVLWTRLTTVVEVRHGPGTAVRHFSNYAVAY